MRKMFTAVALALFLAACSTEQTATILQVIAAVQKGCHFILTNETAQALLDKKKTIEEIVNGVCGLVGTAKNQPSATTVTGYGTWEGVTIKGKFE